MLHHRRCRIGHDIADLYIQLPRPKQINFVCAGGGNADQLQVRCLAQQFPRQRDFIGYNNLCILNSLGDVFWVSGIMPDPVFMSCRQGGFVQITGVDGCIVKKYGFHGYLSGCGGEREVYNMPLPQTIHGHEPAHTRNPLQLYVLL